MDKLFTDVAAMLADHPEMGRKRTIAGTREWIPHENYRLVYETDVDTVRVLAWSTLHACGRWLKASVDRVGRPDRLPHTAETLATVSIQAAPKKSSRNRSIWCIFSCRTVTMPMSPLDSVRQYTK